jgi:hypothetical protein
MPLGAFLTGFFDEKATIISRRKDEGDKYFEQQAERARRVASTQLAQRRERYQQLATAGNTLINTANMPEYVLRGLVSAGPEAVETALQLFGEVPQHEWTANDWEEIYSTSQFYAQEFKEDFNTFLKRTTGLLADNYRATKETGGDLQSAFVASALGYDAKDRARSRLQDYEVAPGISAQQALDMESRPLHQADMDATYSGPVPRAFMGIAGQYQDNALSPDDLWKWRGRFEDEVDKKVEQISNAAREQGQEVPEGVREMAKAEAALEMARLTGPDFASQLTFLHRYLQPPSKGPRSRRADRLRPASTPAPTADGPVAPLTEAPNLASRVRDTFSRTLDQVRDHLSTPVADQDMSPAQRGAVDPSFIPAEGQSPPAHEVHRERMRTSPLDRGAVDPSFIPGERMGAASENMATSPVQRGAVDPNFIPEQRQAPSRRELQEQRMRTSPAQRGAVDPEFIPGQRANLNQFAPHEGWSVNQQGQPVTPDGRVVSVMGIDPDTRSWVYKDLQTGEEFHVPIVQQ